MRKLGKTSTADVIALDSKRKREVRIEMGVDEAKKCVYIKMSGVEPCVAMDAERAESFAQCLMEYVHELRNGGQLF